MASSHPREQFDIAVVGGGPSGRIAALALAQQGLACVLIAPAADQQDGRTTALWQKSIDLLRDIGVWPAIEGNAETLKKMRMIDSTGRLFRAPEVIFDCTEIGLEEFGFNILNSELNVVLEKACATQHGLEVIVDTVKGAEFGDERATLFTSGGRTISARLAVAADGRKSTLREAAGIEVKRWSYPQVAVVLNLEHRLPHQQISTEFHAPTGPFTLVPLPGRQSSLVCVETAEGAANLLAMTDEDLEAELERRAHSILGSFKLASKPQSFPLAGLAATSLVGPRLALVGETAHVFPPIGAQGLNLSMRDIRDLTTVVAAATRSQADIGGKTLLASYEKKRFSDIRSRTNAVDVLNRSLLTEFLPVQAARSAGMYLTGKVGPLRRILMREGIAPGTAFQLHR